MIKAPLFLAILLIGTSIAQKYHESREYKNSQRFDDFDWKLTKIINEKEKGNFVVSPLSVKLALATLYPGIQGVAAREIDRALHINTRQNETVLQKFSSLIKSLETNETSSDFNIGTTVFADKNFQINSNYRQELQHYYNSTVQMVDFASKENTKAKMNDWCNTVTKGKLQNMFNGDEFNSGTAMMLLNAIFFRGDWQFPFHESGKEMFFVSSTKRSLVQMMSVQSTYFDYYEMNKPGIKAGFIRFPYMGGKFAMYIIYPLKENGLEEVAKRMSPEILSEFVENKFSTQLDLMLPKFKFDSSTELIEVLKMMNIKEMFGQKADLHLMGSGPKGPLAISKFLQKSGIDVNEKGSTASAATALGIDLLSAPLRISITHPFMFLIVDESQYNIIFIGEVIDPSVST